MAWSITSYFPPWGDSGEQPPDNFQYDGGDQVNEKHLDYLWNSVGGLEDEVRSALNDIDSDGDGIVDEADSANAYKGNDIDSDGDGKVDSAESADDATNVTSTYKGNDIDSDGDGTVDTADYANDADASTYKGNDIDSDGDGKVDSAASADDATNVTSTYKGNDIDSNGDGKVDSADTADTLNGKTADDIFQMGKMDEAETFTESDVTVGLNNTNVDTESIQLQNEDLTLADTSIGEAVATIPDETGAYGVIFNPNQEIEYIEAGIKSEASGYSRARVMDSSGNQLDQTLGEVTGIGGQSTFEITGLSLSAGTDYYLVVDNQGSTWTASGSHYDTTVPQNTANFDVTGSVNSDSINDGEDFFIITFIEGGILGKTNGSVTVEWPVPNDVYEWDRATFKAFDNQGTVDVYVEESTDGGSTWTEIAGPISRGDNIPASNADSEIRFRVDFSRPSDTDTSPVLHSIYRRWLV